ncbi:MAG: hypothetical protein ACJAS4_003003 [Bacteriovoracaceae bacterium]|jgi:hypothetical protein
MKFGGLSEKEIEKITKLLGVEGIVFEIKADLDMIESNEESMKHNLRHLSSPSISTHVLSLDVEDDAFSKMSEDLKAKLLVFGITDQVPDELEFTNEKPELIQGELLNGNKRLIGKSLLHQLIIGGGALIIYFLIKEL